VGLLDRLEIPHRCLSASPGGGLLSHGRELVHRVRALRREIRTFHADVVLTRNPSGVQAAFLTKATGVFDTDDGSAVGIHFHAARPFADVITTPACLQEDYGRRHRQYKGFKALAYLHPDRFQPDPNVRSELGISAEEPFFILRFSAHTASHDGSVRGLPKETKQELLRHLTSVGTVLVSDENPEARTNPKIRFSLPPDRFHDALAAADLCVGDSGSVAAEAAILGTPAFRLSSFAGKLDYLTSLERDYGLVRDFGPSETRELLDEVHVATANMDVLRALGHRGREKLLAENEDVTGWYFNLVTGLASGPNRDP
jgi:uncharacterized protein